MGLAVVRPRAVLALMWPLVADADLAECEEPAVAAAVAAGV